MARASWNWGDRWLLQAANSFRYNQKSSVSCQKPWPQLTPQWPKFSPVDLILYSVCGIKHKHKKTTPELIVECIYISILLWKSILFWMTGVSNLHHVLSFRYQQTQAVKFRFITFAKLPRSVRLWVRQPICNREVFLQRVQNHFLCTAFNCRLSLVEWQVRYEVSSVLHRASRTKRFYISCMNSSRVVFCCHYGVWS